MWKVILIVLFLINVSHSVRTRPLIQTYYYSMPLERLLFISVSLTEKLLLNNNSLVLFSGGLNNQTNHRLLNSRDNPFQSWKTYIKMCTPFRTGWMTCPIQWKESLIISSTSEPHREGRPKIKVSKKYSKILTLLVAVAGWILPGPVWHCLYVVENQMNDYLTYSNRILNGPSLYLTVDEVLYSIM